MKKMFRIIGAASFFPAKILGMGIAEWAWIITAVSAVLKMIGELLSKKKNDQTPPE